MNQFKVFLKMELIDKDENLVNRWAAGIKFHDREDVELQFEKLLRAFKRTFNKVKKEINESIEDN